jgi:hypothetical protein
VVIPWGQSPHEGGRACLISERLPLGPQRRRRLRGCYAYILSVRLFGVASRLAGNGVELILKRAFALGHDCSMHVLGLAGGLSVKP